MLKYPRYITQAFDGHKLPQMDRYKVHLTEKSISTSTAWQYTTELPHNNPVCARPEILARQFSPVHTRWLPQRWQVLRCVRYAGDRDFTQCLGLCSGWPCAASSQRQWRYTLRIIYSFLSSTRHTTWPCSSSSCLSLLFYTGRHGMTKARRRITAITGTHRKRWRRTKNECKRSLPDFGADS